MKHFKFSDIFFFCTISLVLFSLIREVFLGYYDKVVICMYSFLLLLIPRLIKHKLNIKLDMYLEVFIYILIFGSGVLGEVFDFYNIISWWDLVLHMLNGLLWTGLCFSILNKCNKKLNFLMIAIFSFCFSMTIGILCESLEYTLDKYLNFDGQKDTIINKISSTKIDGSKNWQASYNKKYFQNCFI